MPVRGQVYVRLEHDQWDFARTRASSYHAAIVAGKHLAPYPEGHPSFGQSADRLASAVTAAGRALVVDPGTPALCSRAVGKYASAARLRRMGAATAVPLPLTIDALRDAAMRDGFVDATMQDQRLGRALAAPYLESRSAADDRHRVNLQMLRRVVRSAGTQVPIAFIQTTRARLLAGLLEALAADYAATGVGRVFLRVRGVGEDADRDEFSAYLRALDAFTECGVDVIFDCVGRLGPVLVHEGALGFSTGSTFFRTVAQSLLASGGGGGGPAVSIESASGWHEFARDSAEADEVGPCPEPSCPVGRGKPSLDDLREHRLHTLGRLTRVALARDTAELVRSLRASAQPRAVEWAEVLSERRRRAA